MLLTVTYILELRGSSLEEDKTHPETFNSFSQFLQVHDGVEDRSSGM